MNLLFLYGPPASGKLTIGRELAALTGYKLFHNHLAVDLLLSVFDFGTPSFVELREQIWLSVFEQACRASLPGLIFTFAPEPTVRATFITQTIETITKAGSQVHFVELTCPVEELTNRIDAPSRRQYQKLTDPDLFHHLQATGAFTAYSMPPSALTIDTSLSTPTEAATRIAQTLRLEKSSSISSI